MTTLGLGLILFTSFSIIIVLVLHRYTKRFLRHYYFWGFIGLFSLVYFFAFRYVKDIVDFLDVDIWNLKSIDLYTYSFRWSKLLLLDLCPFTFVVLNIALVFDRTRNFAKIVAPFSILGGFVTMVSSIPNETLDNGVNVFEYFFVGQNVNRMFFIIHYWAIILGILVLLNSKTYTRWSAFSLVLFFVYFLCYALICIAILGITNNTTGLTPGDWYNYLDEYFWFSQYGVLYNLIELPYQAEIALWYTISGIIIIGELIIKNWLTKDKDLISRNLKRWYLGNKVFEDFCFKIDSFIDVKINSIKETFRKRNIKEYY